MAVVLRYYDMLLLLHLIRRLLSYLFIRVYVSWKYSLLSLVSLEGRQWWNIFFLATRAPLLELVSANLRRFGRVVIVVTVMSLFETLYGFDAAVTDLEIKTPVPLILIHHICLGSLLKSIYLVSHWAWVFQTIQIGYRLVQSITWWINFWNMELILRILISVWVYNQWLVDSSSLIIVKFLKRFSQVLLVMRVLTLGHVLLILWLLILYRQISFWFNWV